MRRVGLIGVSSHSFRRTALTQMSNNGTPLRVIQEVSGHRNLEQLQVYIEVRDELECILNKLRKKSYGITLAARSPPPPERA
jgi:integrase